MILIVVVVWIGVAMLLTGVKNKAKKDNTPVSAANVNLNEENSYANDDEEEYFEKEQPVYEEADVTDNGKVSLFDTPAIINEWKDFASYWSGMEDNRGNTHDNSYVFTGILVLSDEADERYNTLVCALDGKYTTLDIPEMYLTESTKDEEAETYLEFYSYDSEKETRTLIAKSPGLKKGSKTVAYTVDVTGVEDMMIKIVGTGCLGMDEAWLY